VVRKSSPASSRTAELPFPSQIKPSRPATTRDSNTKRVQPEFHSGRLSTVPQKTRHCSGMAKLIWTSLQHAWVSSRLIGDDQNVRRRTLHGRDAACCVSTVVLAHFGIPIQVLWISVARSLGHRDNEYSA